MTNGDCGSNGVCSFTNPGSSCTCNVGYNRVESSCIDINECNNPSQCPGPNIQCINLEGTFECLCIPLYVKDGNEECTIFTECTTNGECGSNGVCSFTNPGRSCTCNTGYNRVNISCIDINECENPSLCLGPNIQCNNLEGSYECMCLEPYVKDGNDECTIFRQCLSDTECGTNGVCRNMGAGAICGCVDGYIRANAQCDDIDECANSSCAVNEDCTNMPGSYNCDCMTDYARDPDSGLCTVFIECRTNGDCGNLEFCDVNTCACIPGYEKQNNVCQDIDECSNPSACQGLNTQCENNNGSFNCPCQSGFLADGSGQCTLILECSLNSDCIGVNQRCVQVPNVGFLCNCVEGHEKLNDVCVDIDECQTMQFSCASDKICENTAGNYQCICEIGFINNSNNQCEDINECTTNQHNCPAVQTCMNTQGGYDCVCSSGYDKVGDECQDTNECTTNQHNCPAVQTCMNTQGSYDCVCSSGYDKDGDECLDINECASTPCEQNEDCVDMVDRYQCNCRIGFFRNANGDCEDEDECADQGRCPRANENCVNTIGSYMCVCNTGYSRDLNTTACEDINECFVSNTCGSGELCTNEPGSHSCNCIENFRRINDDTCIRIELSVTCLNEITCYCSAGYTGDVGSCQDVDECAQGRRCTKIYEECVNTQGSFSCICETGYERDGNNNCVDERECLNNRCTGANEACRDTPGSYICDCASGYGRNTGGDCQDVDECSSSVLRCSGLGTCSNTIGSFACMCTQGYIAIGSDCTDFDECSLMGTCSGSNMNCINTIGSYVCGCNQGYIMDTNNNCIRNSCLNPAFCNGPNEYCDEMAECNCDDGFRRDNSACSNINECVELDSPCASPMFCVDLTGSFRCECPTGSQLDAGGGCEDVNECSQGTPCIGENMECENTMGNFTCNCLMGYVRIVNNLCVDVDECVTFTLTQLGCDEEATVCLNSRGSYSCPCKVGYQMNIETQLCEDILECSFVDLNNCDVERNEICVEESGSFRCNCMDGYTRLGGDATAMCTNINECGDSSRCRENEQCMDLKGSFVCTCKPGYEREGGAVNDCIDIDECEVNPSICDQLGALSKCVNTASSYSCLCIPEAYNVAGFCMPIVRVTLRITDINYNLVSYSTTLARKNSLLFNEHSTAICAVVLTAVQPLFPSVQECVVEQFKTGSLIAYVKVAWNATNADKLYPENVTNAILNLKLGNRWAAQDGQSTIVLDINAISATDTLPQCRPDTCNNGTCTVDEDILDIVCKCSTGFQGVLCQIEIDPTRDTQKIKLSQSLIVAIAAGGGFAVLLLLFFCFCCVYCMCCRNGPNLHPGNPAVLPQKVHPGFDEVLLEPFPAMEHPIDDDYSDDAPRYFANPPAEAYEAEDEDHSFSFQPNGPSSGPRHFTRHLADYDDRRNVPDLY